MNISDIIEGFDSDSDGSESLSNFLSFYDNETPRKFAKLSEVKSESPQSSNLLESHATNSECKLPVSKEEPKSNTDFLDYQGVKLESLNTNKYFIDQDLFEDNIFVHCNDTLDEIEPSVDNFEIYNSSAIIDIKGNKGNSIRKAYHSETKRSISRRENNPLLEFYDDPSSSMKKGKKITQEKRVVRAHPKKEYYRVKLLRAWKKALRNSLNKRMKSEANEFELKFIKHGKKNYNILFDIGKTENGPLTEAQSRRINHKNEMERTFNNKYVQELFKCDVNRTSFELYVNSQFYGKSCEELNKEFFFMCCNDDVHNSLCQEKWERLRVFTFTKLLTSNLESSI